MYNNESHHECPYEQGFFSAIFSEAQKLMVTLTQKSARQLCRHILTEYILFKKKTNSKLKMPRNMQWFVVAALNSIHLHFISATSKGVWSSCLYLTVNTSELAYLLERRGGKRRARRHA